MPIYEFRCTKCGNVIEIFRKKYMKREEIDTVVCKCSKEKVKYERILSPHAKHSSWEVDD